MISSEDYDPSAEYTSLLIEYATPMAAATLPRFINTQTNMQAAAPAFQTARLLGLLGFGLDAFRVFGFVLIAVAALSLFIGLYNALKDRTYDIAILRSMGASRGKVMQHVLTEGLLLALGGALLGLGIGHLAAEGLGQFLETSQGVSLTGATFVPEELLLVGLAVVVGAVAALLPAVLAYRTDISGVLARG
ncbi:MAG: FtsX-like permease family protein [Bacteroidota bacterium]